MTFYIEFYFKKIYLNSLLATGVRDTISLTLTSYLFEIFLKSTLFKMQIIKISLFECNAI